jgi:uncharacterized DUF497 family protein
MAVQFVWDPVKNRANRLKHHLGFETAALVFDDPNAVSLQDRDVEGEQRSKTIGLANSAVVVVAHTFGSEGGDELIRIISARKATRSERRLYEEEID